MQALCQVCLKRVEAAYRQSHGTVAIDRDCPDHGETTTMVSSDADFFQRGLDLFQSHDASPRGLIVELLDGCNMRCPTCIAGSAPGLGNYRSASVVSKYLESIAAATKIPAIFLSGGEPTIHPELGAFLSLVEDLPVCRRILITNGVRISQDRCYAQELLTTRSMPWEVFLQFDSNRPAVLEDIRGSDLRSVRLRALKLLEEHNIPTTLVCVVKRGVNLDEVGSLVEFAKRWNCVVGVQFQPIRDAGRLDNFDYDRNACDLGLVRRQLLKSRSISVLEPHPANPISIAAGYYNRQTSQWKSPTEAQEHEYYIDATSAPDGRLRVSVVEYSDQQSWSTLKSESSPIDVLQNDGTVLSVDDHFLG